MSGARRILLLVVGMGLSSLTLGEERQLSRSIYVPVIFSVETKLAGKLVIGIGDEEYPRPPERHTFLFTLYPDGAKSFCRNKSRFGSTGRASATGRISTAISSSP